MGVKIPASKGCLMQRLINLPNIPCAGISKSYLQRAVDQGVTFITTIDTLFSCVDTVTHKRIHSNTMRLASKGAKFIYGSEIRHNNAPWGINGEKINFMDVLDVFKAVASEAGKNLGNPLFGAPVEECTG